MIAPSILPQEFDRWNRKHSAPFGRPLSKTRQHLMPDQAAQRYAGPFAIQPNNATRAYEYPWAFHVTKVTDGLRVLEIGGGLSGFQFVLDKAGCSVVNADPGMQAQGVGWHCDPSSMTQLNRIHKTSVELRNTTVDKAGLQPESFDRAYSISVIEHLPDRDIANAMRVVYDCLKPGGHFVLTVDLFLNLAPFTSKQNNKFGLNIDIKKLVDLAPFETVHGNPQELNGFDEFDPDHIQSNLENYLVGSYPALVQTLVLKKPQAMEQAYAA